MTASPNGQAQRDGRLRAGVEGEDNEIADFFEEGGQLVARRTFRELAQLLRAGQRGVAAIEEGLHVYHRQLHGRWSGANRLRRGWFDGHE